ncbi:uncharacterized protein LOC134784242 [Penaeus indicus]|uniref:uncharacterized protein LOC134784242 n=1 Tax=Penaeus indicus TaxID=29960 RepID=UPI00300C7FF0
MRRRGSQASRATAAVQTPPPCAPLSSSSLASSSSPSCAGPRLTTARIAAPSPARAQPTATMAPCSNTATAATSAGGIPARYVTVPPISTAFASIHQNAMETFVLRTTYIADPRVQLK